MLRELKWCCWITFAALTPMAFSCKGDSKPSGKGTEPSSIPSSEKDGSGEAQPTAEPTVEPAPETNQTGLGERDVCVDPCLNLATTHFDDLMRADLSSDKDAPGLCSTCKGKARKQCESVKLDCQSYDYFRNCIYAANGYAFKKAKYKKIFRDKAWYREDTSFEQSKLSKTASENVAILKYMARGCARTAAIEYKEVGKKPVKHIADLDGDGIDEAIEVDGASVTVNGERVVVDTGDQPIGAFAIIDLKPKDRRREILLRHYEYEDISWYNVAALSEGKLYATNDSVLGGDARLPGDGRLLFQSQNCGQRQWTEYALRNKKLKKAKEQTLGKKDESLCAACPFAYVDVDGEPRYAGEILRNLRSKRLATTQSLELRSWAADQRTMTLTLSEEKDEITYLDEIHVATDSGRLEPSQCKQQGARPSYCDKDGRHFVLRKGEKLSLEFENPTPSTSFEKVWATGYYVPTIASE